jgi:hypothetical protein
VQEKSAITRTITTAPGVYAPGHLSELTQSSTSTWWTPCWGKPARARSGCGCCPRVVVYFALALALFEHCSYRTVWGKLTAALGTLTPVRPAASPLARARRRVGTAPLRRLFETLAGPVADPGRAGSFHRGLRTVALDGTHLHVPDDAQVALRQVVADRAQPERSHAACLPPLTRLAVSHTFAALRLVL